MSVLLTVPHAGCFDQPQRHCDLLARKAALNLQQMIPGSRIIIGETYRPHLDLNRDEALDDSFRLNIRQQTPSLLLDIHSFPRDDGFNSYDLVIIDEDPVTDYSRDLYRHLVKHLPYNVGYFSGEGNSIVREARQRGIPAILIEYGEFLISSDLTTINQVIGNWVNKT